jgi:hypothetical protein
MARRRWRHRCRAHRSNGQPCRAWSIDHAFVCAAHGGRAPRVRQAAAVRRVEDRLQRAFSAQQEKFREERTDWWTARIMHAAAVLDRDPMDIVAEVKRQGWIVDMIGHRWPAGLRLEDEPQPRVDHRFRPRF